MDANEFGLSTSSYLGDGSDLDEVRGAHWLPDGTLILAANLGEATPAVAAATGLGSSVIGDAGYLVGLTSNGQVASKVVRIAERVYDLSADGTDHLAVAAGFDGVLVIDPALSTVVGAYLAGEFVYRVDAAPNGFLVALVPDNLSDPDQTAGPGTVYVIDPSVGVIGTFRGPMAETADVAIDSVTETVYLIGFTNTFTWGGVGFGPSTPVDVPALFAVPYNFDNGATVNVKWSAYNAQSNGWLDEAKTIPNPHYINAPFSTAEEDLTEDRFPLVESSNMANTRGIRVEMGQRRSSSRRTFRTSPRSVSSSTATISTPGGTNW